MDKKPGRLPGVRSGASRRRIGSDARSDYSEGYQAMNAQNAGAWRMARLDTPTDLASSAMRDIAGVASASLLESLIDEAEGRTWFLYKASGRADGID
jgi:hypothetical protein